MSAEKRVFKYTLPAPKRPMDELLSIIDMPVGAEILDVQVQNQDGTDEGPQIWALVDPSAPTVRRGFTIIPTGIAVPDWASKATHLKTFQLYRGRLVFHVFEKPMETT